MKNKRATNLLLAFFSCCLILVFVVTPNESKGDTDTETKIRLMSEALTARNAGDLDTAMEKLDELQRIAPEDRGIQRLRESVQAAIDLRDEEEPEVEPPVVEEEPAPVVEEETRPDRRISLWSEAIAARSEGDFDRARRVAETIRDEFPQDQRVDAFLDSIVTDRVALEEARRIEMVSLEARAVLAAADEWIAAGEFERVVDEINAVLEELPENVRTADIIAALKGKRSEAVINRAYAHLEDGDFERAQEQYDRYRSFEVTNDAAREMARRVERGFDDPSYVRIRDVSPEFESERERVRRLIRRGRAQFLAGDLYGAEDSFRHAEGIDPQDPAPKTWLRRIAEVRSGMGDLSRQATREALIQHVAELWDLPQVMIEEEEAVQDDPVSPLVERLTEIEIPSVNFSEVPLREVITTLSEVSREYDPREEGINIILRDPDNENPPVSISLTRLPLNRILEFVTEDAGFQYQVEQDVVIVTPADRVRADLTTDIFPIDRSTLIRMTGGGAAFSPQTVDDDPFGEQQQPQQQQQQQPQVNGGETSQAIRGFLEGAGISFPSGTGLVYDGTAIIVTQTPRNIDRIRNLLARYADVRQVEIEARFLEVQQGSLDEFGVTFDGQAGGQPQFDPVTGLPIIGSDGRQAVSGARRTFGTQNRALSDTITGIEDGGELRVDRIGQPSIVERIAPPSIPGTVRTAAGVGSLATFSGSMGSFDIQASIRALARQEGSDLLSAPKVTVLSGETANIVVAQEFRYPENFSQIQSQVGTGTTTGTGTGAGVTITAGTPSNFQTRNVGVELSVLPTVEDDDRSITLELFPQVTEFEGFVEYGGPSIAIQGETTVTVPSGFFQPIFATRSMETQVTVWDGATLVMGGLTREEVRMVKDKVPILGDIPLLGRLFRSEGEASQKRNLLIFVTANLVTPGGSLKNQELRNVSPGSMYQAPTHLTPGGSGSRIRQDTNN